MQGENPYSAPRSERLEIEASPNEFRPAGRGARLGAILIDTVILIALLWPLLYVIGFTQVFLEAARTGHRAPMWYSFASLAMGLTIYTLVHGYPLAMSGQTWGKKWSKVKVVDLQGRKPSLWRLLFLRYAPTRLVATAIPVVGPFLAIIDDLFIFRDDKRCIHDHIAGTRVVVAD